MVARPRAVGPDEIPGLGAEQVRRRARGRVEIDAPEGEAGGGDASHRRAQAVVGVEGGLGRQRDLALELDQLARAVLAAGAACSGIEPGRVLAREGSERPGNRKEKAERSDEEQVDVDGQSRRAGLEHDRRGEAECRHHAEQDERLEADHSAPRRSSRSDSSARIASSFMAASIVWGLNFARSNDEVRRSTDRFWAPTSGSTRPRYSRGASAGSRGRPASASASSICAYAAITAFRGAGSARRSAIVRSSASTSSSATFSVPGSLFRYWTIIQATAPRASTISDETTITGPQSNRTAPAVLVPWWAR